MEVPVPEWMTTEFMTQCLQREDGKEDVIVTNLTACPAVSAGNNYGSCVLRIKVEYKKNKSDTQLHSISLVVKSELSDGPMKDMFDVVEPAFYHRFLPLASKFAEPSFAPKNFFSPNVSSVVVLEDLKERGFVMADRIKKLDFDHCRLYVNAAASMHALSVAVHKEQPDLVESIGKEKLFADDVRPKEAFKRMIRYGFRYLADVVETMDDFKKYTNLIRDLSETLWDLLVEVHETSQELNALNQGDPWTTNMMFRYEEDGNVGEIKLLDFQALKYGSPVNDIVFFCWSSGNHDVRRHHLHELHRIYLDSLNKKLEEIGCDERLSHDILMEKVRSLNPLVLFVVMTFGPYISNPAPADFSPFFADENPSLETENPYQVCYTDTFRNDELPKLLEDLEAAGVFEYMAQNQTQNH